MAILSELPGIEVTVCLDDQPLWEYNDDEPDVKSGELGRYQASKTVSKYVQSFTDQEFAIKLYVGPPYEFDCATLGFDIFVDGRKVKSPILQKKTYLITSTWQNLVDGIKSVEVDASGCCQFQKFKFAKLETTDDEDKLYNLKEDARCISEIGEIAVWVYRKSEAKKSEETVNRETLVVDYTKKVHEKALKGDAKSHGTALGKAQPAKPNYKWFLHMIDGKGRPIAIYKFKYRSREALQSLLVIPRTPEPERPAAPTPRRASRVHTLLPDPTPSPLLAACSATDLDNATPVEKLQLAAYLTGLRAASPGPQTPEAKVKQVNSGSIKTPVRGIKRENRGAFNSGGLRGRAASSTLSTRIKHEPKEGGSASRKQMRKDQEQNPVVVDLTKDD